MKPKYKMTIEENIFVAKRNLVDYIWKSANLEGIAVTYPDTQTILDGISISNIKVDDIIAINNLKNAWRLILENIDYKTNYSLICEINKCVGSGELIRGAGFLRNVPVSMGGTTWKPDMPIESQIKEDIEEINSIENATDRAITLMLYCMRKQMFLDGNKRTAMLAANHILVSSGEGIISVPIELQREFSTMLLKFYESNEMEEIKTFVYEKCIDGIDFSSTKEQELEYEELEI